MDHYHACCKRQLEAQTLVHTTRISLYIPFQYHPYHIDSHGNRASPRALQLLARIPLQIPFLWYAILPVALVDTPHPIHQNNEINRPNTYSRAFGTTKPTTTHPIAPAIHTTIRMLSVSIKNIVEIETIVAINKIIDIRLRVVNPPFSLYSRIYLPKKDDNNHARNFGELR